MVYVMWLDTAPFVARRSVFNVTPERAYAPDRQPLSF